MKKIYLTIILAVFVSVAINAQQECWNNINTTTTKWDDPNTSNITKWDWTLPGLVHEVYLDNNLSSPSILVELPYFCTKPVSTSGCGNNNTYCYEVTQLITGKQDIYPEDGWELLLKDFGTPTLGGVTGRKVDNPVFIIYNRYTGKMKVYVAVIGTTVANSAYLQIFFEKNSLKNGLYTHANAVCKPLLEFETTAKFKALNEYAVKSREDDYQWLVAEIQTAYDPCICASISNVKVGTMEVKPVLIDDFDINAQIEGTTTQVLANSSTGVNAEADGKTSFQDIVVNAANAAIKGYNDFGSYKSQVDDMLNKSNKEYKDKLVKDWFDDYVKKNPQYQGVNNLPAKYALWDALGRTDDAFKRGIGIDKIGDYQGSSEYQDLKTIASFVPYVGSAIGLIDFFMNGGKSSAAAKPSPPMVFNVSLKLNGHITKEIPLSPIHFLVPGSKTVSSNLTPIYNNILGVFNILKAPQFKFAPIARRDEVFKFYDFDLGEEINQQMFPRFTNFDVVLSQNAAFNATPVFKQYKLNEDIKYIVNPAANLEVELIDACFVLEYNNTPNLTLNYDIFPNFFNQPALPYYPDLFNGSLSVTDKIKSLEKAYYDLEYISYDNSVVRLRTKYVPLTCLKNVTFTLFNGVMPKVYVKMLVKYKGKNNPELEPITNVVTYDITSSFTTPVLDPEPPNADCRANFKTYQLVRLEQATFPTPLVTHLGFKYQELLSISCFPYSYPNSNDVNYVPGISSMMVPGNIIIPSNTSIPSNTWLKARKIVLGNNITINDNVELVAEEPIELTEESTMYPNSVIRNEFFSNLNLWNCPDVNIATLHATEDEIKALCDNSAYKAKAQSFHKGDDLIQNKLDSTANFGFTLFPNPAQNNISITVACSSEERIKLSVVDITGKEVSNNLYVENVLNGSVINVDLTELSSGIYFCSLVNNAGMKMTKKFIIAK
ncbi:MAG: T9SS type A sorting domain-containing protein [Bacteroidota bacterium]